MKASQEEKPLMFGELIMAVYGALGKRRARGIVWLAINARLVEFRGHDRFVSLEPGAGKIFHSCENAS